MTTANKNIKNIKGFTLIELLIVMAILGVLAVVVLVAINPVQQLARTRDTGRFSSVTQIGRSVQAYYTSRNATYPDAAGDWGADLEDSGELSVLPSLIENTLTSTCSGNEDQGWCYDEDGTNAVVYSALEADVNIDICDDAGGGDPYAVYSTADGRGGLVCSGSEPSPGTQDFAN